MKKTLLAAALLLSALTISAQDYTHSVGVTVGNMYGVSYKGFIFGVDGLALQADLGVKLSNMGKKITQTVKYDYQEDGKSQPGFPVTNTASVKYDNSIDYLTFELNPNIVYQMAIADFNFGKLSWYAGGGISLGLLKATAHGDFYYDDKGNKHNSWWAMSRVDEVPDGNGGTKKEARVPAQFKFGFNAVAGLELNLNNAPIVIGLDFRPGYGLGAYTDKDEYTSGGVKYTDKYSFTSSFFDWTLAASVRYRF